MSDSNAPTSGGPDFPLREEFVFQRLGISDRAVMRKLRKSALTEGEDFVRENGRVVYREAAVEKLAASMQINTPEAADAAVSEPVMVQVLRSPLNRQMLEASLNGGKVRVRGVRNNELFVKGQVIPTRHVDADLYEFTGVHPMSRSASVKRYHIQTMNQKDDHAR